MAPKIHLLRPGQQADLPEHRTFTSPEAARLCELTLIENDLTGCLHCVRALTNAPVPQPTDILFIEQALFRDIVVQFVACFDTKNSLEWDVVYEGYDDGEDISKVRKHLVDLRNGYAAHRHGIQRQCDIIITEVEGSLHCGPHWLQYSRPGPEVLPSYERLVSRALEYTTTAKDQLGREVARQVGKLSAAQIAALPTLKQGAPASAEMQTSRGQKRAGKPSRQTASKPRRQRP